jgi:asparagine synthase (glutamine-hydrolysing)
MCGILGIVVSTNSKEIDLNLFLKMRDTMTHRGPDGAGVWISNDKKIGFGHRRLSIVDLSETANQPMSNHNDEIWITFNGEIYNHAELRVELSKSKKYKWKTDHSDTEVIIHAYEEWGIDFIHKLRGQYAIGIWDNIKKVLYLVRDRLGIKPLYYTQTNSKFYFASEIKAIIEDRDVKREVNIEAFYDYLSFLTTPAPKTLFKNINKLGAGQYLKLELYSKPEVFTYWDVLDNLTDYSDKSDIEVKGILLDKLSDAVKSHKMSDVPIGVFLSGGVDSSTNAVLFANEDSKPVETFTIGYKGTNYSYPNENEIAKNLTESIGGHFNEKLLTQEDFLNFLPTMIKLQDEPIADPVCFPVYFVSKLAKDNGVTVCQVGEGADELFYGYSSWYSFDKFSRNLNMFPKIIKRILLIILKQTKFKNSGRYELLKRNILNLPILFQGAENPSENNKNRILSKDLLNQLNDYNTWASLKPFYEKYLKVFKKPDLLSWLSYSDLKFRLPELLLMRVDKMSMGVSIETRVPFLDHHLVEFAMSLPLKVKFKDKIPKYLLKNAVRGVIPNFIIDRQKQGFGIPMSEWLKMGLKEKILLSVDEFTKRTNFFDREEIMTSFKNGDDRYWVIYNFILWYNEYIEDKEF